MSERRKTPVVPPHVDVETCTPDYRKTLIGELPLFQGLSPGEIDGINTHFRDSDYTPGDVIIHEGESAARFFVIALGVVSLVRTTETGETIVLDILTAGETFGTVAGFGPREYTETAVAGSVACILWIDSGGFRSIIDHHPPVAIATIEYLSRRLRLSQEMVTQLGGYSAEVRIAYVILRLADKLGQPWQGKTLISAYFGRDQIASMAGTTTETCSRIISKFRRQGLVEAGRNWIAIADIAALKEKVPTE